MLQKLLELIRTRPAETLQSALGDVVGAVLILSGLLKGGFDFNSLSDPEVQGAALLLFSKGAAVVTFFVAKKQRNPADPMTANVVDGTVETPND